MNMPVTVRRLGRVGMTIVAGATLLHICMPVEASATMPKRDLTLRVSSPSRGSIWAVRGRPATEDLRAAHSLAATYGAAPGRVLALRVALAGGPREAVLTNAGTVGELLVALEVHLSPTDIVRPSSRASVAAGMLVRVTLIRWSLETLTTAIAHQTLIRWSKDVPLGQTLVISAGRDGRVSRTFRVTYRNGREVSRVLMAERRTFAVDRVVARGTAPTPLRRGTQCGIASWYGRAGSVAAHKTLPFGTRVSVRDVDNGRTVAVVINDRGPYVAGRIIDLSDDAFSVLAPLGQGIARVCITW